MKKKRILSLLMALTLFISLLPHAAAVSARDFTDISEDDWCFEYVDYVTSQGYFLGTTDTTFSPNRSMTRAMFVVVLSRYDGARVNNSQSAFTDVEPGAWCAGAINWAAANGIVGGYEDGTFRPDQPVTRAQMCAIMDRYVEYYCDEHDVTVAAKGSVSTLADQAQIPSYAVGSVRDCQRWGLINGYADGTFRPQAESSRAHVAAVIYRLAFLLDDAEPNKPDRPSHSGGGSSGGSDDPSYTYRLTYDANGGLFSNGNETMRDTNDSRTFEVTDEEPTRADYTFLGWSTDDSATTASYRAGDSFRIESSRSDTLYAVWEEDSQVEDEDLIGKAVEEAVALANNRLDEIMDTLNDAINEVVPDSEDAAALEAAVREVIAVKNEDGKFVTFNAETRTVSANVSLNIAELINNDENGVNAQAVVDAVTNLISSLLSTEEGTLTGQDVEKFLESIKAQILAITGIDIDATSWAEIKSYVMSHLQEEGANLWVPFHQNTGAYVTDDVKITGGGYTVTAIVDEDAQQTTLSVNKATAVKEMALAIAKEMFADLKDLSLTAGDYISEAELKGIAHVKFSKPVDPELAVQTEKYPYEYNVCLNVNLNSAGLVSYKYDTSDPDVSANYFKVTITNGMQDMWDNSLNMLKVSMVDSDTEAQIIQKIENALKNNQDQIYNVLAAKCEEYQLSLGDITPAQLVGAMTAQGTDNTSAVDEWYEDNIAELLTLLDPGTAFDDLDLDHSALVNAVFSFLQSQEVIPQSTTAMQEWIDAMIEQETTSLNIAELINDSGIFGSIELNEDDPQAAINLIIMAINTNVIANAKQEVFEVARNVLNTKLGSGTAANVYSSLQSCAQDYLIYSALCAMGLSDIYGVDLTATTTASFFNENSGEMEVVDGARNDLALRDMLNVINDEGNFSEAIESEINDYLSDAIDQIKDELEESETAEDLQEQYTKFNSYLERLKFKPTDETAEPINQQKFSDLARILRDVTNSGLLGNRGDSFVADTLSVYLTKLMGVIPDGASITVNGEELKGEDLGAFADADTTADLLDALADLCERDAFKVLSINSFAEDQDAGLTGIPVTVQYNSRTFNFNFVIEIEVA